MENLKVDGTVLIDRFGMKKICNIKSISGDKVTVRSVDGINYTVTKEMLLPLK